MTPFKLTSVIMAILFGLSHFAVAQEAASEKKPDSAWIRVWASLGDKNPAGGYTLTSTFKESGKDWKFFSNTTGLWNSGTGADYLRFPPGKCKFRINKEGTEESAPVELERDLKKDIAYTLLVVLTDGKPVFNLVEEYPSKPEVSGIYVYSLLKDVPLQVTVGDGQALQVPYSATPTVLGAAQVLGKTVSISAIIKNKTQVLMNLNYTGTKTNAVLLRNRYQQPYLLLSTAQPPGE